MHKQLTILSTETTNYLQKGGIIVAAHKEKITEKIVQYVQVASEIDAQLAPLIEKGTKPSSAVQKMYENYLSLVRSYQAKVLFVEHASDEEKVSACTAAFGPAGIPTGASTEELLAYYEKDWQRYLQTVVDYEDAGLSPRTQDQAYFDERTEEKESEEAIASGLKYELNELKSPNFLFFDLICHFFFV